jgi:hypothetical protein
MGTARRKPGNPEIRRTSYQKLDLEREEAFTSSLSLRITASMRKKLDELEDYRQLVREAIKEKLSREGANPTNQ